MKRTTLVILKNLYHLPYSWIKLCKYAKNPDKYPEDERFALMRTFSDWMVKDGNITLEVHGENNIPKENGFMIFPNHQGIFDGFAIAHGFEKSFSVVYKKELDEVPFINKVFESVKGIALDREDAREGIRVINLTASEVKTGRNFLFFAEGTRSKKQNEVLDFKGGSFKSAIRAKCPIMPVALIDSYKVFDENTTNDVTVQVHLLKPIEYEEYKNLKAIEIAEMVKEIITTTIKRNTTSVINI